MQIDHAMRQTEPLERKRGSYFAAMGWRGKPCWPGLARPLLTGALQRVANAPSLQSGRIFNGELVKLDCPDSLPLSCSQRAFSSKAFKGPSSSFLPFGKATGGQSAQCQRGKQSLPSQRGFLLEGKWSGGDGRRSISFRHKCTFLSLNSGEVEAPDAAEREMGRLSVQGGWWLLGVPCMRITVMIHK